MGQRISDWKLEISEDFRSLGFGEFAPLAGGEVGREMEVADGHPEEAEGWVAGRGGHFADLAVAAFVQGEFDPVGRDVLTVADGRIARGKVGVDVLGLGGKSSFSFDDDSMAELLQRVFGHLPFDLRPVSAGVGVFRVEKFGVQSGFVG